MLFFFDYSDPLSWTVELLAGRGGLDLGSLERFPFASDVLPSEWDARVQLAGSVIQQLDVEWVTPSAPVRSQKAFELAFHGAEAGCFEEVHAAIFEAHFASGRDIARIDELVTVANGVGLDASEAKAVLDVDRHAEAVRAWRARAERLEVVTTPTVVDDGERWDGIRVIQELQRRFAS